MAQQIKCLHSICGGRLKKKRVHICSSGVEVFIIDIKENIQAETSGSIQSGQDWQTGPGHTGERGKKREDMGQRLESKRLTGQKGTV